MNNPLVQPDPGLFIWTILTFLVLLALLAKFAWRPLLAALDTRQEAIKKSLEDAEKAKQELARLQHESTKIIEQARVDAESILAKTRSDAERLREDLKAKAKV
jgi:F-type H+-transporting ATPase subunit b